MLLFKRKRKPGKLSLIRLPFAHGANGGSSYVHLKTKKQMEVLHLQRIEID